MKKEEFECLVYGEESKPEIRKSEGYKISKFWGVIRPTHRTEYKRAVSLMHIPSRKKSGDFKNRKKAIEAFLLAEESFNIDVEDIRDLYSSMNPQERRLLVLLLGGGISL
jgi:hypothetical protein